MRISILVICVMLASVPVKHQVILSVHGMVQALNVMQFLANPLVKSVTALTMIAMARLMRVAFVILSVVTTFWKLVKSVTMVT